MDKSFFTGAESSANQAQKTAIKNSPQRLQNIIKDEKETDHVDSDSDSQGLNRSNIKNSFSNQKNKKDIDE